MQNSKAIKIAAAVVMLGVAAVILMFTMRKPALPGDGDPALVTFPDGSTLNTTWKEVFARAQNGKAHIDRSPGGGWMYTSDSGQTGRVTKPGEAAPTTRSE